MSNPMTVADREIQRFAFTTLPKRVVTAAPRRIVFSTRGRQHGPITRLVSPSDVGELIKPFVFLDHGEIAPTGEPLFGIHPHSGIATLSVVLSGRVNYEDTTGKQGTIAAGGLEWMKAGNGVWHDGGPIQGEPLRFYQLWVAHSPNRKRTRHRKASTSHRTLSSRTERSACFLAAMVAPQARSVLLTASTISTSV